VLSVLLLFKYVRQDYGDEVAFLTIAFLSFFPTSLFLSAGYTESLVLLLILCCLLLLKREQYIPAAVFAGLACATRSTGVVLLTGDYLGALVQVCRRVPPFLFLCIVLLNSRDVWSLALYGLSLDRF